MNIFNRLHETDVVLSDTYQQQMTDQFGPDITHDIQTNWQHADLAHKPGEKLLYVRLGKDSATHERPVLYVPGFTEGIVAKAPFAAAMAERGFDFMLPGQHRRKNIKEIFSRKGATYAQAANYMAVLEKEGLTDQTVDVTTHSYGSLIFQSMQKIAKERGYSCFDGSEVALLAPAGSNKKEGLLRLGGRFAINLITEAKTKKDFPDPGGEQMKAGTKNFIANLPRTLREIWSLGKSRVDYGELAVSGIGRAVVFGHAEDRLFPHKVLESTMAEAMEAGIAYATPISWQEYEDGQPRLGRDASHNDEQTNPSRAADAVADFLRAA